MLHFCILAQIGGVIFVFYDNYINLCVRDEISPSAAASKAGLASAHVYKWKKGSQPNDATICKLMNANGWSREELIEGIKKAAVQDGNLSAARNALIEKVYSLTDEQCEAWLRLLG